MQFEFEREPKFGHKSAQLREAWLEAWPRAKKAARQVEVNVRSGQPWAEVWTRKRKETAVLAQARLAQARLVRAGTSGRSQAEMWREVHMEKAIWWGGSSQEVAQAMAKTDAGADADVDAEAKAEAQAGVLALALSEALALAGVWSWARGGAHARGQKAPSVLADSETIWRILSDHHHYGLARYLWHHSAETREEYSCMIQFIAPVTRLPLELLQQIFSILIDEGGPPVVLMLVCKYWHAIVTSMWASLNLGTRTPLGAVTRKLERNQQFLDIVVDTDSDRGDFTPSFGAFEAIFAAVEATPQWRSFVVESFPAQADLPEDLVDRRLQQSSNATMSRFTTFKFKSTCETSPLLNGLLRILGTTAGPQLTTVEINSANVILFLAPDYQIGRAHV